MTRKIPSNRQFQNNTNRCTDRARRTPVEADDILREIAFVLAMSAQIREEIEAEGEDRKALA